MLYKASRGQSVGGEPRQARGSHRASPRLCRIESCLLVLSYYPQPSVDLTEGCPSLVLYEASGKTNYRNGMKAISNFVKRQPNIARLYLPQILPKMIKFTRYLKRPFSCVLLKDNGSIRKPLHIPWLS